MHCELTACMLIYAFYATGISVSCDDYALLHNMATCATLEATPAFGLIAFEFLENVAFGRSMWEMKFTFRVSFFSRIKRFFCGLTWARIGRYFFYAQSFVYFNPNNALTFAVRVIDALSTRSGAGTIICEALSGHYFGPILIFPAKSLYSTSDRRPFLSLWSYEGPWRTTVFALASTVFLSVIVESIPTGSTEFVGSLNPIMPTVRLQPVISQLARQYSVIHALSTSSRKPLLHSTASLPDY